MMSLKTLKSNSPPHRWLRNEIASATRFCIYSPPHRWLRKIIKHFIISTEHSPPHRWLRNYSLLNL
ncbi:hypothetical protein [uncultured Gammaproteobacteria bacterium]|nr:hypothetical protein [uncultured Gammaproteobacteria bacterium]